MATLKNELTKRWRGLKLKIRVAPSAAAVLDLLKDGDKSSEQIIRRTGMTANQWNILRSQMLDNWQIGTVGKGENKKYTRLNIARTK